MRTDRTPSGADTTADAEAESEADADAESDAESDAEAEAEAKAEADAFMRKNARTYDVQEPTLFDRTLEDNIKYGRPAATFEEVRRAARLANAESFVLALPEGYQVQWWQW